jgi:RNA polymerase sigma-70 factor (ECF subfamily)
MMNFELLEDRELIRYYKQGFEIAFTTLVQRHRKEIFQRISLIVKDSMVAEDILQETFIKIVRSINEGGYNEGGKFLPWALTVARNLCLDYKRKEKRPKHFCSHVPMPENFSKQSTTIKCRISERQLQQQIEYILSQLPQLQREVIQYRHFEDMSFKEIAVMMRTSVNTTTGRMRYALLNLNKLIGENRSAFSNA